VNSWWEGLKIRCRSLLAGRPAFRADAAEWPDDRGGIAQDRPGVSWDQIKGRYEDYVAAGARAQAMVQLVDEIARSRYAAGLTAWTSMTDLCIAKAPASPTDPGPYLKISPHFDGNISFEHFDTYIPSRRWRRKVPEAQAFARLERFFDQLHWFARVVRHDSSVNA
jgi:hypothetical protein